jgi:hypothetical protein
VAVQRGRIARASDVFSPAPLVVIPRGSVGCGSVPTLRSLHSRPHPHPQTRAPTRYTPHATRTHTHTHTHIYISIIRSLFLFLSLSPSLSVAESIPGPRTSLTALPARARRSSPPPPPRARGHTQSVILVEIRQSRSLPPSSPSLPTIPTNPPLHGPTAGARACDGRLAPGGPHRCPSACFPRCAATAASSAAEEGLALRCAALGCDTGLFSALSPRESVSSKCASK